MRVPVNSQTNPGRGVISPLPASKSYDVSGFAQGAESLGASLNQLHQQNLAAQRQEDQFNLSAKFLQTLNERQADFQQRTLDPNVDLKTFPDQVLNDYAAGNAKLVGEAEAAGFDKNAVREFALKLQTSNNSFAGQALNFQQQGLGAKALVDTGNLIDAGSRQAEQNPGGGAAAAEYVHNTIAQNPWLTPAQRAELQDKAAGQIASTAATAYTMANPQDVVDKLGRHFYSPGVGRAANPWAQVAVDVAQYFRLNPVDLAAAMHLESGFNPQAQNAGGYLGLIQLNPADQRRMGITKDSSPEDVTKAYIQYFTEHGLPRGASLADIYSTILTGGPGRYDRADSNGTSVNSALAALRGEHTEAARAWLGAPADTNFRADLSHAYVAQTPAMQQVDPDTGAPLPGVTETKASGTGIWALDNITGAQQLELVNRAQGLLRERNAQDTAVARQQIENANTAHMAGQSYAGPLPSQEELTRLFGEGTAAVIQGKLNATAAAQPIIAGMATANTADMAAKVAALEPKDTSALNYSEQHAVWEQVQAGMQANLRAREADPATYIMQAFPNIAQSAQQAATPRARQTAYQSMANAYRQLGIPADGWLPVPKDQVPEIRQQYANMPPPQKLQWLQAQYNEMTGTGLYVPFMTQLNEHGSGPGYDSYMMSQLLGHPEYNAIMTDVLHGQQVIAEDPARKPDQGTVNRFYISNRGLGKAVNGLNPTASRIYNDEATAIYVSRGGTVGQLVKGQIDDTKLYQDSLRRAMGGLANNPDTGYASFQGSDRPATILPPSVTKQEFQNWTDRLNSTVLNTASGGTGAYSKFGKPVLVRDIIDHGAFVMRAAGQYAVQFPDGGTLLNNRGGEYIIRITPQLVRGR